MARLSDISDGQMTQFKGILAKAGLDSELVDAILLRHNLAEQWVSWLRSTIDPASYGHLFEEPSAVLAKFIAANETFEWGFTSQIKQLESSMPAGHVNRLDNVLSIRMWLGDKTRTKEAHLAWMDESILVIPMLAMDEESLEILGDSAFNDRVPYVQWVELDLTASRGAAPKSFHGTGRTAGIELMACAALHPDWFHAIDNGNVPAVFLEGLGILDDGQLKTYKYAVPVFRKVDDKVVFTAEFNWLQDSGFTIPQVRAAKFMTGDPY